MIPKKIHYCWFGRGPKTKLAKKCISSWRRYCPDYEIIEWNEDNFDLDYNEYTRYCYDNKKWAFLSDLVRLLVIYQNGGIYFDTDVELLKPMDDLLDCDAFYGFENEKHINTGQGFGAIAGQESVRAMICKYKELKPDAEGNYPLIVCPKLNTMALIPFGLELTGKKQNLQGVVIYSEEYFNPMNSATGKISKTGNTYSIHRYSMSWLAKQKQIRSRITRLFHRMFGINCFSWLKKEYNE